MVSHVALCRHAVVRCAVLEAPVNGALDSMNTTCDTVVRFRCDDSYELAGSSTLTCLSNGEWDNNVPRCYGKVVSVVHLVLL